MNKKTTGKKSSGKAPKSKGSKGGATAWDKGQMKKAGFKKSPPNQF